MRCDDPAALSEALCVAAVPGPAQADWRGRGYGGGPRYYGGYGGGWHHHHSAPLWPWIAGGVLGLGALGALAAPPTYYVRPPVYYAPRPAYYAPPPPVYYYAPPPRW
jgi:hypothetical protein